LPFWSRTKDAGDVLPERDPGEGLPPVGENRSATQQLRRDDQPASDAGQGPGEAVTEDGAAPSGVPQAAGEAEDGAAPGGAAQAAGEGLAEDGAAPAGLPPSAAAAGEPIDGDREPLPGAAAKPEPRQAPDEAAAADQAQAQARDEETPVGAARPDAPQADQADGAGAPGPPSADSGAGRAAAGKEQSAGDLGERAERTVADRPGLPAAAEPALRQQLAEFVELDHRVRVPSLKDRLALDPGESITTTMVNAMACVISHRIYPGSAITQEQLTKRLMTVLAEPAQLADADDVQLTLPIANSHGRISLDVSVALDSRRSAADKPGPHPCARLVRAGDRLELSEPVAQIGAGSPAGLPGNGAMRPDGSGPGGESPAGPPESPAIGTPDSSAAQASSAHSADLRGSGSAEVKGATGTAVLIWGPAAAIADDRRYLSIDALISYGRKQAFKQLYEKSAPTAAQGMRAVRGVEVVVLLDKSIGGGLWIDIDPLTGRPCVALAIEVMDIGSPNGIRVTRLAGI
jgi:hypothetical protein